MPSGLQGLISDGRANVRRQLQTDDPSSPANALGTLLKWWSDWRAQQAAEPDITNPPVGFSAPGLQGLMGILRDAAGKPMKMYHGTNKAFGEFDPAKADPQALYGRGHYFTNSAPVAEEYAFKDSMNALDALGGMRVSGWMNYDEGMQRGVNQLRRVVESEPSAQGANVRPAFLDLRNPFDMRARPDPAAIDAIVQHRIGTLGPDSSPGWRGIGDTLKDARSNAAVYDALVRHGMPKDDLTAALRAAGYDGITHTGGQIMGRGGPEHEVGIAFDAKQILPPWRVPE